MTTITGPIPPAVSEPDETPAADAAPADAKPVSYGQEQLWFLDQLDPGATNYNLQLAWRLRGSLDLEKFDRAVDGAVARHAALRTVVASRDGAAYQVIREPGPGTLGHVDLRVLPEAEREDALKAALAELTAEAFDLENGPLHRFRLFRIQDDEFQLSMSYHHLITDGWSSSIVNAEIAQIYTALVEGREPDLPEVEFDFPDFAAEQRERLSGEVLEEELEFWKERLAGLPTLELPTDRPRPPAGHHRGGSVYRALPERVRRAVSELAKEHGVSQFMVLSTALNVVLARYSGQDDIPVGVPMLGRPEPELEAVVGFFTNMVVLRSDLSGDPTFAELLERSGEANLDLYDHQEVPFPLVVDRISPPRDPSRNPLFQVSTQLLGGATLADNLSLPGVTSESTGLDSAWSQFDLTVNFVDNGEELGIGVDYSVELFDRWRIEALCGHIGVVLLAGHANASLRLSQLPLLDDAERAQVLTAGRGTPTAFEEGPVHTWITRAAAANPDSVAVVCKGVEISYAELDRRADQLARYLRVQGLRRGQIVAVVIDRDIDAYVAILGVLKAGGAFTVLDPKHPATRLDFMIRDTAAPLVITRESFADRLPQAEGWRTVLIDAQWPQIEAADRVLEEWSTPDSLAYVLYTSGSTGMPKGVMITHRSVALFADGYQRSFDFGPQDRLLQLPSLTFDMSQGEIWAAWKVGAEIVAVAPEEVLNPDSLSALMRDQSVTYAGLNPTMLSVLEPEPYPALKYVMGGAEILPPELVNKWNLPGRVFLNLYGPTEAAIACTEYVCEHKEWRNSPPIGRPQVNRQVYIVDKDDNLLPRGVAGQLLIGGHEAGLAEGYLNQPELTAQKFTPDPFHPGRLVYRSGDLVRWTEDLQLDILGRLDNQVKLRGLRIELGEIEAALVAHLTVDRAVVLMRPDKLGDNRLIGYVTAAAGQTPDPVELAAHLAGQLPEYMVPAAWVVLEDFPLSSGWKIDRKALPDPVEDKGSGEYVAPATPTEEAVAAAFRDVLGREQVGANEGFFTLGGNSLQGMRTVSRINKSLGVKISIRLLYGGATLSAIAAAIDGMLAEKAAKAAAAGTKE
jgi:amino acid adenylation domain-containing protein